jgi:hypothetical protein
VNSFSSDLFSYITVGKINRFGAVHPNHKGMQYGFGYKTLKMKWGDIKVKISARFDWSVTGRQKRIMSKGMLQPLVEFNP